VGGGVAAGEEGGRGFPELASGDARGGGWGVRQTSSTAPTQVFRREYECQAWRVICRHVHAEVERSVIGARRVCHRGAPRCPPTRAPLLVCLHAAAQPRLSGLYLLNLVPLLT